MIFNDIYLEVLKMADSRLDVAGVSFINDEKSRFNGQMIGHDMLPELVEQSNAGLAAMLYSLPESKYYHSEKMLSFIKKCCESGLKKLNDDFTANVLTTNFHTPEQFGLNILASGAIAMRSALVGSDEETGAYNALLGFVEAMGYGALNSGFHTPNHRWIESAALLLANDALGGKGNGPALVEKANKYLAEGIDCDEYGEWSERSAGMYNAHCDEAFLRMYYETNNKEFLDAVCRNLELMQYYIKDDFSMFTQNSRRTDKGEVGNRPMFMKAQTYYADIYLELYMVAGYLTNNAKFAAIAKQIYASIKRRGGCAYHVNLECFTRYPELRYWDPDTSDLGLPTSYDMYWPKSNIVRRKDETATYSIVAGNPSFLQIESQGISLYARICSSFFAVAQFVPRILERTDDGYRMVMKSHGEYKLPLDDPDESCKDYWSIERSRRKVIQPLDFYCIVDVKFIDNGIEMTVETTGCDMVPLKLEFAVNPGLICEIGNAIMITKPGMSTFVREGSAKFKANSGNELTIDGLFCGHLYAEGMRGSMAPIEDAFTVFATDFSPTKKTVRITFDKIKSAKYLI